MQIRQRGRQQAVKLSCVDYLGWVGGHGVMVSLRAIVSVNAIV